MEETSIKDLDIKKFRSILYTLGKKLELESELTDITSKTFNLTSSISSWVVRKKQFLLWLIELEDVKEELHDHLINQLEESTNTILNSKDKQKCLKGDKRFSEFETLEKLLQVGIDFCEDAKKTLEGKGYQIKNKIDWERWKNGVI